jgi:hypothetical protein
MKQEKKKTYEPKKNNIFKLKSYLKEKEKNGKSN